jgi:hypothetical protein
MLQMCRDLGFSVGFDPDGGDIMKVVLELGNATLTR